MWNLLKPAARKGAAQWMAVLDPLWITWARSTGMRARGVDYDGFPIDYAPLYQSGGAGVQFAGGEAG